MYDDFCLKMGNLRIRWYLGSQGEGKKSIDVNAGSAKDNGIYSNFRERQFLKTLFSFLFLEKLKKMIKLLTHKTKEFNHK